MAQAYRIVLRHRCAAGGQVEKGLGGSTPTTIQAGKVEEDERVFGNAQEAHAKRRPPPPHLHHLIYGRERAPVMEGEDRRCRVGVHGQGIMPTTCSKEQSFLLHPVHPWEGQ